MIGYTQLPKLSQGPRRNSSANRRPVRNAGTAAQSQRQQAFDQAATERYTRFGQVFPTLTRPRDTYTADARTEMGVIGTLTGARPGDGSRPAGGGQAAAMPARPFTNLPAVPDYGGSFTRALSAEEELAFNNRVAALASQVEAARNATTEGRNNLELWANQAGNAALRSGAEAGRALRNDLSGSGLGFSPMFLNRGMRDIAGQVAAERNRVEAERAARSDAYTRMLQAAELAQTQGLADIDLQKAMLVTNPLAGLFGGMG